MINLTLSSSLKNLIPGSRMKKKQRKLPPGKIMISLIRNHGEDHGDVTHAHFLRSSNIDIGRWSKHSDADAAVRMFYNANNISDIRNAISK
ncbi:MAG: hypothetical protein EZS28_007489 [Streblomastix strix]|uniref:Uncharacterized protein n=1 Tax=Streblomastix strix TaxID=222440 RepID=A0A5J4WPV3_9EUKA|nr:MAG: hypothetical protein EZS28_007489 [Streblomastix strix]